MNHILENFIHHSWKQKSHTSQKCEVGPLDVTWLGLPPGGFSNLLAGLETRQQVSFMRVEGMKRSQELISSCSGPTERNGCTILVKSEMKVYPILGSVLSIQQSTYKGSITVLPERVVVFNAFIFVGRKGWYCASDGEDMNGDAVLHPTLRE